MRVFKALLLAVLLAAVGLPVLYFASPRHFLQVATAGERALAGLQREEVDVAGLRIAYLDSHGQGEPLVLVHGFGGEKDNWTRLARHLAPHYRVIALDLPGYGQSSAPPDAGYRISDGVDRLHAFLGAIGLQRAHLGGNSMGGHIVAAYAARYPNDVGSLWLIDTAGVLSAPLSELRQMIRDGQPNPLVATTPQQFRQLMALAMSQPPPIPARIMDVLAERAVAVHELRSRQFAQLLEPPVALEGVIDGLPIPVHILWGQEDRLIHVGAVDVLKRLLPQASVTVLPGIGHVPMIEAPEATARDYLAFRDALRRAPAGGG